MSGEKVASSSSWASATAGAGAGGSWTVDMPSSAISNLVPNTIVSSANELTRSNEVNLRPSATQSSPSDGATTPEDDSWVTTFVTASASDDGSVGGGSPVPSAHSTSGNVATPSTGGISSLRL